MGIKRFLKKRLNDRTFIRNKRKITINNFDIDFFRNYEFDFESQTKNPKVSIIISVYNQVKFTLNCLYTIEQHDKDIPKEIIIINDNSSDDTLYYLNKINGIRVINNAENLGFLKNVNKGIEAASGEYIYLLNNDVEVQDGYLKNLLKVFRDKENVGAVGSKLIFPDSTLQEAGCLIFEGSEIVNLGSCDAIDNPKFNYLRKVDYCSGCSLLFRKNNSDGYLNLLDEAFLPAYYEETDFCQRLKYEQGLDIYYQPKSEIVHYNNVSYIGKDDLLEKNREVFKSRWNRFFSDKKFLSSGKINYNVHYRSPAILILEENMPKPDKDSGSRRLYEIIKILQKDEHRIILAVKNIEEQGDDFYIDFFRNIGVEVCKDYVNTKDEIVTVTEQVMETLSYVNVIWIFRPLGFDYWFKKIKNKISGKKIVYDMVDLHYLRMERENSFLVPTKKRKKETSYFRDMEYFAMEKADAVISISDEEKEIVSVQGIMRNKIFTVSNIHQRTKMGDIKWSDRSGLLFIGGYYHMPNVDAVRFLYESIMPLVWKKNSLIQVKILGSDFPENLMQQYHSDRFQILGYQESVDDWFENARIFVAPLRYGAGVKGKIGQALEFGLPVITTPIGAEGMGLEDQVTASVSNGSAEDFAERILQLYDDEELWNQLHANSELPLSKFSIEAQGKNIRKLFNYLGF